MRNKGHKNILTSLTYKSHSKLAREHNVSLLKKTYNNGLITLKEYTNALKNYGITTSIEVPVNITEPINKIEKISNTTNNNNTQNNIFQKNLSNILSKHTEEKAFILNDGRKLYSIQDLVNILDQMPQELFQHHTGQGRNDFATWIRDVFDEKEIASLINSKHSKEELIKFFKELEKCR
jgi:hypothetical protein